MVQTDKDTIAAVATATGKGGIGIVRVSGPLAKTISSAIISIDLTPRQAQFGGFYDSNKNKIDEGITLYFPSPHSFTGEDIVEFQAHGNSFVLDLILQETIKHGARLAKPGEFSERAFLNDKIDLVQAEAIADIIESSSVTASRSALKSLSGEFSKTINQLSEAINTLRIYVEAAIDFPEEEIDFISDDYIHQSLETLINNCQNIQSQTKQGVLLRDGLSVVIVGKPNAGKSSLLNCFAKDELAIVNAQAGTTRDVLRETIQLDGIPLKIIDTAGLRLSEDEIELEGIRRIKKEIEKADIVIYLQDINDTENEKKPSLEKLLIEFSEHQITLPEQTLLLVVNNKIDMIAEKPSIEELADYCCVSISAKHALGLDLLTEHIKTHFGMQQNNENIFIARRRHLDILKQTQRYLLEGKVQINQHKAGELLAEDLRKAQETLGQITGKTIADDLLGDIFSSFCIGK